MFSANTRLMYGKMKTMSMEQLKQVCSGLRENWEVIIPQGSTTMDASREIAEFARRHGKTRELNAILKQY